MVNGALSLLQSVQALPWPVAALALVGVLALMWRREENRHAEAMTVLDRAQQHDALDPNRIIDILRGRAHKERQRIPAEIESRESALPEPEQDDRV